MFRVKQIKKRFIFKYITLLSLNDDIILFDFKDKTYKMKIPKDKEIILRDLIIINKLKEGDDVTIEWVVENFAYNLINKL